MFKVNKTLFKKLLIQLSFIILLTGCKNDKLTEIDNLDPEQHPISSITDINSLQSNRSIWKTDKTHIVELLSYSKDFEGNLFDPSFMVYTYLDIPANYNFEIIDIQRFEKDIPGDMYPQHIEVNQIIGDIQKLYNTQDIPIIFEENRYPSWAYQYHGLDDTGKHRYAFFFGMSNLGPAGWYECSYFDISFDNQLSSEDLLTIIQSFRSEGIYSRYIECIINLDTNSLYSTTSYRVNSVCENLPKNYIRLELPYRLNLLKDEAKFKLSTTPDNLFDIDLDSKTLADIDPLSYFEENRHYPYITNELSTEATDNKEFYGIIKLEPELYLHVYFKIKSEDYIKPKLNSLGYVKE